MLKMRWTTDELGRLAAEWKGSRQKQMTCEEIAAQAVSTRNVEPAATRAAEEIKPRPWRRAWRYVSGLSPARLISV